MTAVIAQRIRINGTVQGVGFRPTVWRLARECEIVGEVWNDGAGVVIHAWASKEKITGFVQRLRDEVPPLASIDHIDISALEPSLTPPESFQIIASRDGETHTAIAADAATCPDCLAEILEPGNRRYRYPFTNCTHCGPRLSIVRAIPYDRVNTSMSLFNMCPACQAEYDNPADRRFHAQPNCCPECGPQLWLEDGEGNRLSPDDVIAEAARQIKAGRIIAIKGIGGFHLACDAGNSEAVETLRQRKQRYHKAFALMARDIAMVKRYAAVTESVAELLHQPAAPIVVLEQKGDALPEVIAPGQSLLGFMLPYTPLHHLLMQELTRPIVLTSGNHSHEPQVIDNGTARERLNAIADTFLLHDRDIVNRLDDSVVRVADGKPRILRRARGYAPQPIRLHESLAGAGNILAMGAELKNAFCLIKDGQAVLSQHIGDLEEANTYRDYRHNLQLYRQLYDFNPSLIAVDAHPNYLSTQLGRAIAAEEGIPLIAVQHHHAHIAACMAEHGLPLHGEKVLGVALDGLGYGDDGELWGGEFLLADYAAFERVAHCKPVAMPGGAQAIHQPWRNTFAHLDAALGWNTVTEKYADLAIIRFLNSQPVETLQTMIARGLNSPSASSAGRLFDGVAAALGLCREQTSYEGQAAIELEALATPCFDAQKNNGYEFVMQQGELSWGPLWSALLDDLKRSVEPGMIAARFHHSVCNAVVSTAVSLCEKYGVASVVLSGGVFQNRLLLQRSSELLRERGFRVLSPVETTANDGGVALGQGVVAFAGSISP